MDVPADLAAMVRRHTSSWRKWGLVLSIPLLLLGPLFFLRISTLGIGLADSAPRLLGGIAMSIAGLFVGWLSIRANDPRRSTAVAVLLRSPEAVKRIEVLIQQMAGAQTALVFLFGDDPRCLARLRVDHVVHLPSVLEVISRYAPHAEVSEERQDVHLDLG